ncbi:MAG: cytochrome-c oxidase [Bradyrhizobium sp.]|nr:MAG: cytochrome-c oxidase [Bradyrhizobium sp.]
MKSYDSNFIAIGALWLVVGMLLGIGMGASHDFTLAPLHAHINLIGFVCHSIFGLAYRSWPGLKTSALAPYQFWIFVIAAPITLLGLYFTVTGGPELPTIVGSIAILIGAVLFAVMIWMERMRS